MTYPPVPAEQAEIAPTVAGALAFAARRLGGESRAVEGRMLLAHLLGRNQGWLIAHPEATLAAPTFGRLAALLARRAQGEPMAYLLGQRGFYDVELTVTPAVLIPRPETEGLVEAALELVDAHGEARILDLGTGSGNVAIALARARPRAQIWASDLSGAALAIAAANAGQLCPGHVHLLRGHWTAPIADAALDLLIANPPYVASDDHHLERGDLAFEPRLALDGGTDGLNAYRELADDAPRVLAPGGWLLVEHGFHQGPAVRSLLQTAGLSGIATERDLASHERITRARRASNAREAL